MHRTLVVAGISGDLAKRKIVPALRALAERGALPFAHIVGTTRRTLLLDDVLSPDDPLSATLTIRQMDIGDTEACKTLAADIGTDPHAFYLSVPPGTAPHIAAALSSAGFGASSLVLEKPFGFDAASSAAEVHEVGKHFPAAQVYRVDHYLGKALAADVAGQGRGAAYVDVLASEALGVEGRASFYEQTGALRDFGNHLLTLAALALGGASAAERLAALRKAMVVRAARAQYEGYCTEVGNLASETETFFAFTLQVGGTSVLLASGKGLAAKSAEVKIIGTDKKVFADASDHAYEVLLQAVAAGAQDTFLTLPEVAESWRIMDAARAAWGSAPLATYPRGTALADVLAKVLPLE